MRNKILVMGGGALVAALAVAGAAAAQTAVPSGPPPSWESLIPCAQKSDPVEGFKCYQAAMNAAGFTPNAQAVAAEKRRTFGLPLPSLHAHKKTETAQAGAPAAAATASASAQPAALPPEPEDQVTVTLESVAVTPPLNRLLLVTTEGAVWQQTDNDTVAPLPKPGQTMTVEKGHIDGFFCRFDKRTKVRCKRMH
jgi:hypothetical protein